MGALIRFKELGGCVGEKLVLSWNLIHFSVFVAPVLVPNIPGNGDNQEERKRHDK